MAKSRIPDPIQRRHWLERPLDPVRARAVADAYLEQGRHAEAVAFLEKADATDALEKLAAEATARGDAFLLKQVCSALGREPSSEEWGATASAAEAAGLLRYASTARRQASGED